MGKVDVDVSVGVDYNTSTGSLMVTISRSRGTPASHDPEDLDDATVAGTWADFYVLASAAVTSQAAFLTAFNAT